MLKMLDEKVLRSDDEMEDLYKDCKYLYIITVTCIVLVRQMIHLIS